MAATHNNAGIVASSFIATKKNASVQSFSQALAFLHDQAGATQFKVGDEVQLAARSPNLRLRVMAINPGPVPPFGPVTEIGVVLYNTVIVTYRNDETFTTDSGGFATMMTCTRITQFTPAWADACRGDRTIFLSGFYADKNANRFRVPSEHPLGHVVGQKIPAPKLKRGKASEPHGRLRFLMSPDGDVYSLNDNHPKEFVYPSLEYDKIGRDAEGNFTGDYTAPLTYELKRDNYNLVDLRDTRGISQSDLPLDLLNAHRQLWEMPIIEIVEA